MVSKSSICLISTASFCNLGRRNKHLAKNVVTKPAKRVNHSKVPLVTLEVCFNVTLCNEH